MVTVKNFQVKTVLWLHGLVHASKKAKIKRCSYFGLHFDSVLILVIVTKISLSIAIMFYALVYDDDVEDDAGLSRGAGTNLKLGGTSGTKGWKKFFVVPSTFFGFTSTISRFGKRFRVVSTV